jgi:hypothetical protein
MARLKEDEPDMQHKDRLVMYLAQYCRDLIYVNVVDSNSRLPTGRLPEKIPRRLKSRISLIKLVRAKCLSYSFEIVWTPYATISAQNFFAVVNVFLAVVFSAFLLHNYDETFWISCGDDVILVYLVCHITDLDGRDADMH